MDKKSKNTLYLFGLFLIVIIAIEIFRPQPVNWNPGYTSEDTIPFGCFVLHKELQELMELNQLTTINESPFTYLMQKQPTTDTTTQEAYVFINNYLYFDPEETTALLDYVEEGNIVFLAASYISGDLIDSLNIETVTENIYREREYKALFYSPAFDDTKGMFKRGFYKTHFTEIDTLNTTALGYFSIQDDKIGNDTEAQVTELLSNEEAAINSEVKPYLLNKPAEPELNFIKVSHGKGYFYLHTIPQAFSNYYLLNGNAAYAAQVFSHFDADTLFWDDYKKSGRRYIDTPMRYILSELPLKWAYYLSITGILLFVIFKGKREQRIIPVIKPLENTTVEFTKTIGDLYYQNKNYSNIINKKITYFLERIRSRYYLDTQKINIAFAEKLAQKKGKSPESVLQLINLINRLQQKQAHTEADLIALNEELEKFEH